MRFSVIILTYFLFTSICLGQKLNAKKIAKTHDLTKILSYDYLGSAFDKNNQRFFALHLVDNTTRIYDNIQDTIGPIIYANFHFIGRHYPKIFSVESNDKTQFYTVDLKWIVKNKVTFIRTVGELEINQFDSIQRVNDFDFIGYKNSEITLFDAPRSENRFRGFKVLSKENTLLTYFSGGVLVKHTDTLDLKSKIIFLDFNSLKPRSSFEADSIYNYPTWNSRLALVKTNDTLVIYNYEKSRIAESNFQLFYIVPICNFPLVVQPNYIAFGDFDLIKVPISNVVQVDFIPAGDYIYALAITASGERLKFDLINGEIFE